MKTMYISQLSKDIQNEIEEQLLFLGLTEIDIETAMSSRLCDLEDIIDINYYLNKG